MSPSAARASARRLPTSPVERTGSPARAFLDTFRQRVGLGLEPRDNGVDFGAGFAQSLGQLVVQALLEDRFAFRQPRFTVQQAAALSVEPGLLIAELRFLLFDGRQLLIDAREVRGEQRFAARAPALGIGDDLRRHAQPPRHFERQASARRAVDQRVASARTSRR